VTDRYRILAPLGAGGMGTVYEALHLASGGVYAMKVLHAGLPDEVARRFEREARATSLLDHPGVVDVLDFGRLADGRLFLVMELVRGTSLADVLSSGPLPVGRAVAIAGRILGALAFSHRAGIVHRDLKPDNVMLLEGDAVKLVDFGIAKLLGPVADELGGDLTRTGVVFGTPAYMAPEQALGRAVDARVDLYSLGVILYELLAGRPPFASDDPLALLRLQCAAPPPPLPPSLPGGIERIVLRALAKRAEARYQTAEEMHADLLELTTA
jgi:eukaryotic-like serine/threonine-protein kinase